MMKQTLLFRGLLGLAVLSAMTVASCSDTTDTEIPTTDTAAAAEVQTEAVTEAVHYEPDGLPELDFGGAGVHIFGRTTDIPEYSVEEENGDIVNDAIFVRNRTVEERLNVKLSVTQIDGGNYDRASWVKTVTQSTMAGDSANDIVGGYSMTLASLANERMLLNLYDYDYLDFDKPWWPPSLNEEASVGDALYFCSGDISTHMIYYLYATYFNRKFIIDYDLEDPYQLVRDGKWTLDKLYEISSQVYRDLNGNGQKDGEDQFGYLTDTVYADSLFFAAGLNTTEKDADNIPHLSDEFGGEKAQALIASLVDAFKTNNGMLLVDGGSEDTFMADRILFYTTEVFFAATKLRNTEIEYGILPIPKYDEAQENYYTISSFPYNLFGIPLDARDPEMSAAVLECMASESYRTVSPALFETALKVKYASDSDVSEMYDLIRASNCFDFGRIFNDSLNGLTYTMFRDSLYKGQTEWISKYTKNTKVLNRLFDKLIGNLTEEQ